MQTDAGTVIVAMVLETDRENSNPLSLILRIDECGQGNSEEG